MKFALITCGWTEELHLFLCEKHMKQHVEALRSSSMFVQGMYKLAESKTNAEYLVTEQYPDFVRTSLKTFRDYDSAERYISNKRKEEISRTFILFEKI